MQKACQPTIFVPSNPIEKVSDFRWCDCIAELKLKAPILLEVVSALVSCNDSRNKQAWGFSQPWDLHGNRYTPERKEQRDVWDSNLGLTGFVHFTCTKAGTCTYKCNIVCNNNDNLRIFLIVK